MVDLKTPEELAAMEVGGRKLGSILQSLLAFADTGVTLLQLEALAMAEIIKAGGQPSFTTVEGYKWATCLCVNEAVVHGIPTAYRLRDDDILTIDIGMIYQGLHTDTAWSKIIGNSKSQIREKRQEFLTVGQRALWSAIDQAKSGSHIGHISKEIQKHIEGAGYSIVKSLVGHGVGKTLHEDPQIPGILKGTPEETPKLIVGETIAIEVIYSKGSGQVVYDNTDGWTISTKDSSDSAVFEHTVAITTNKPVILTRGDL